MAENLSAPNSTPDSTGNPWPALWALVLGFFMILVDSTIVFVAIRAIMEGLHTDVNGVLWVTSAYLLAYAVPLLITGRLGDRYGPKNLYIAGLVLFTASSAWCGFTGSIGMLVTARVFQGLGASLMTPQTMAVITRTFPANRRGQAMALWGAVAGVATMVGPIVGGLLVDSLGWEWIFFINVPVGVIALALAWRLVPALPTHAHRFDWVGVALSAAGMFLVVFGIQEGQTYHWSAGIWGLIGAGVLVLAGFVYWQRRNTGEPLVPLALFADRNFSLSNVAITAIGFVITAMSVPIMLYAQAVEGLSATRSALLLVPMALLSGGLAPVVGRAADRVHPRYLAGVGMTLLPISLVWLAAEFGPEVAIWRLLLPMALLGLANAFIWAPISSTATRNLPMSQAGAGSGIYNTTRQVGAVLGSAAIAVLMESRLAAELPHGAGGSANTDAAAQLPAALHAPFSTAMAQSLLLPAAVAVLGLIAVLLYTAPKHLQRRAAAEPQAQPVAV